MKTLAEFIKEIEGSKELQEELKKLTGKDAAGAFLKKHGCGASADELAEYIRAQIKGRRELTDDEVSKVAGGAWIDVGAGLIWYDDTIPKQKTTIEEEPVLPYYPIEILPE